MHRLKLLFYYFSKGTCIMLSTLIYCNNCNKYIGKKKHYTFLYLETKVTRNLKIIIFVVFPFIILWSRRMYFTLGHEKAITPAALLNYCLLDL